MTERQSRPVKQEIQLKKLNGTGILKYGLSIKTNL